MLYFQFVCLTQRTLYLLQFFLIILYPAFFPFFNNKKTRPEKAKEARLGKLMRIQQRIAAEIAEGKIGTEMDVVIDRREGDYYIARSEYSSPEVDPEVLIPVGERILRKGCFYKVRITAAEEFDLYATTI